jgi:rare lipoprotein A
MPMIARFLRSASRRRFAAPRWIATALAVLLAGCGSTVQKDGAPLRQLDPDRIRDAVPKREPITRAGNKSPYTVLGKTYHLLPTAKGYRARGTASWYGTKFHGRTTANGEKYDVYAMTAAHTTLPIPTYVRVTNLENGRQAVVRVNDRGPFAHGRIIDLSYAAATKLGFAHKGTALVEVEAIDVDNWPPPRAPASTSTASQPLPQSSPQPSSVRGALRVERPFYVQVGAFGNPQGAEQLRRRLQGATAYPVEIHSAGALYRVRVGPLATRSEAEQVRAALLDGVVADAHVVD